jgi:hypothetical protein
VFAAGYAIAVMANFSSLITAINMDADAVIAPVMGQLLGSAPHGSLVLLGNHPWYEVLWFLRATSGLPHYRQLWDVAPAAWSLAGIAILAWSAWIALGAWPAALAACALLCAGSGGRFMFFTFNWRGLAVVHTVLLGAFVVWLVGAVGRLRVWQVALATVAMGALSAIPMSEDPLFLYWALLPLLASAVLLVWRTRSPEHWRALAVVVAVAAIAVLGGRLVQQAMFAQNWRDVPLPVSFVAPEALVKNLVLLVQSYTYLAGGTFFGAMPDLVGTTLLLTALLFLGALVCLPLDLYRRAAQAVPAPVALDARTSRRFAYIAFWAGSLASTSVVFLLSSAPVDVNSARYLLAGYVAVGALLPLLAMRSRGWKASVTGGVCLFAAIAAYQVVRQPFAPQNLFPGPQQANALVRFARAEHVDYGYASYWDAPELTWLSYFKIKLYPVYQCAPPSLTICPFSIVRVDSWYKPRPGTKSMLVVDTQLQPVLISAPDPALGKPTAMTSIGALDVYIYPYDIAARFKPS